MEEDSFDGSANQPIQNGVGDKYKSHKQKSHYHHSQTKDVTSMSLVQEFEIYS
jgi:hypothetical protein